VNSTKAGQGKFYLLGSPTQDFPGMVAKLKSWAATRYTWTDTNVLTPTDEAAAPQKRTVSYTGGANFPTNNLKFSTNAFAAGNAGGSFAAMQWRIADVTSVAVGAIPNLEINSVWDSGPITTFNANITIPTSAVLPQHTYRVRVRMKDSNGRWSHWSDAVAGTTQFTATAPNTIVPDSIRVTEFNYNPEPFGTTFDAQQFEFIELKNFGAQTVNLQNCFFDNGITFIFGNVSLAAGQVGVVVASTTAFQSRYGTGPLILGSYGTSATNFSNGGEHVGIQDSFNQTVADFTYSDSWYPSTDGAGPTLQTVNPAANPDLNLAASWIASAAPGGTPGIVDTVAPTVMSSAFTFNASPQSVTLHFSEDVHFNLDASDLILTNNTTSTTVPAANIAAPIWDAATSTATFTFPGYAGGQLPGGKYTVTLNTAGVTDGSSNPLAAGFSMQFLYANGTGANDSFVAMLDTSHVNLRVWQNANPATDPPTYTGVLASLSSFNVDGNAGNDSLTLDFSNGDMRPAGGFGYRLGSESETLRLKGPIAWTFASDPMLETPNLNLILESAASVTFSALSSHLASLSLNTSAAALLPASGTRVLVTRALTLDPTAKLDLNDNDLIVDYTGASPLPAVQGLINTARAGGAWSGNGLTSTAAKNANPKNTALGAIEASDWKSLNGAAATFDGETIDTSAVLIKYTYYGDTDFNGVVDFDDYSRTDSGFNLGRTGWFNGDFDGNGTVDFDDYSLIDLAFNTQGSALRPALPPIGGKPTKGKGAGRAS
jgi:hypothetical protein